MCEKVLISSIKNHMDMKPLQGPGFKVALYISPDCDPFNPLYTTGFFLLG